MRQWAEQKAQISDAILLFRMGDFYETFYEDAKTISRVLGIALTSRDKGTPLAGIPYHALDSYLAKLVAAGFKVAISEQMEDPRSAKGVVKREVVRIVTPGTLTEDNLLDQTRNNYLAAVYADRSEMGIACLDLTTGDFFTMLSDRAGILNELVRLRPAEILINESPQAIEKDVADQLTQLIEVRVARRPPHDFDAFHAQRLLHERLGVATLEGFGYEAMDASLISAGAILAYLKETQKSESAHVIGIRRRVFGDYVQIDPSSWRSLEIERSLRQGSAEGTLWSAVNRTSSAMGARALRESLRFPLQRAEPIAARQDAVAELLTDPTRLKNIRLRLRELCDIERITARVGLSRCSPRDLVGLGQSLHRIEKIREDLAAVQSAELQEVRSHLEGLNELGDYLNGALRSDAPTVIREGGIIATGFHAELDRLHGIGHDGQQWLAEYQAREVQRTGISSLKVGFNRVFGYYIEVTHTHRDLVPANYVRKQTIKNAERYITDELKTYETEVLTAQEKANELEYQLFLQIMAYAATFIPKLLEAARAVGVLDLLVGFSVLAAERGYVRPELSSENELIIRDGRHPVLEQTLGQFVPNDALLNATDDRLLIITGPNMAGKSTYIRQVALLVLLAQTGSYVPAASMRWSVVDRIFARVGASDELVRGQSTFMVEMIESAHILNNATERSLVIIDELGRGTSTYDGLSLAWAICEHIARHVGCRTLFATHYHELTELARLLPGVRNYNVAVREWPGDHPHEDKIVFLHKIVEGGTDKSYGVHVAQIAGIPPVVVARSREVLRTLESGLSRSSLREVLTGRPAPTPDQQLELFSVQDDRLRQKLLSLDLSNITSLEALGQIKELQDEAR